MRSRQNPLHLSSCYCCGYRFWGGPIAFQGFMGKSAYSRSNMKPKSIPKQARKWIEQLFCWFSGASATLHVPFVLHLFACIFLHFHAFSFHCAFISFHFPFMFLSLVFMSIYFPFIVFSFSFQRAFVSSHLPFICSHFPFIVHSCPFISVLKLLKWLYGLAREPSATHGYRHR